MKNITTDLTIKAILTASMAATVYLMSGCGDHSKASADGNTATPQSMIADAPKDDGQGVGKFKNVTLGALDQEMAAKGKLVFEAKCTACHNPSAVKKVGPGLKDVTQIRKPEWILNMITNPEEMTKKDSAAKELLAQHLTQMTFQDVTDEQARQVLEFLRKNDGEATQEVKK